MSESMKPSGVSWIGEIPEDWRVEPLKFHCVMFKGLPIQKTDLTDDGRRVVSYGQVHSKLNSGTHLSDDLIRYVAPALAPVSASSRLRRGDLVFADTSEDLEGIGNAVYVDSDDLVFAGYHTVTCRPDRMIDGRYFAYLARVECWRGQLRSYAMGVKVYSITQSVLSKVSVILPPIEEQGRIAAYLDARTADIDAAMADIERQLDVLERYKASVIHEAVTKGLDADAPMKPSGVEWIGDIPAHWQLRKVKNLCATRNGLDYTSADICAPDNASATFLVRSSNIRSGVIVHGDDVYVSKTIPDGVRLQRNDIIIVRTNGSRRLVGKSALISEDGVGAPGAFLLLCRSVYYDWMFWVFNSGMFSYHLDLFAGTTINQITNQQLRNMVVPFCSDEEERARICAHIQSRCAAIDSIIATKHRQAAILKARRQSLIYEYVTGKRRVPMGE